MEVAALQSMTNFQSVELNAHRSMAHGLMLHMEQHVGSLGTHLQEESVKLRHSEAQSEEHTVKER
eukprot:1525286-Prorocentrum_lima.AAC.1